MKGPARLLGWLLLPLAAAVVAGEAGTGRLILGSFSSEARAAHFAERLQRELGETFTVLSVVTDGGIRHRVASRPLEPVERAERTAAFAAAGYASWHFPDAPMAGSAAPPGTVAPAPAVPSASAASAGTAVAGSPAAAEAAGLGGERGLVAGGERPATLVERAQRSELDVDLALQSRSYLHSGLAGQSRWQPSISGQVLFATTRNEGRDRFVVEPFARIDAEDAERTHADLRQFYWNRVGDDWDLYVGVKKVFWGVTEFAHLVDVINQTDLVENIDGEDKLGQPMVHVSLVRPWGIVDLFALVGHRARTFPGEDGRLRSLLPVTDSEVYESGAGRWRVDGAIRYSHHLGPLNFGLHHFSGTERDPRFELVQAGDEFALEPHYGVMDQTGVDAQLIAGDWAFKLEALSRAGSEDRYSAFAAGFERTLVGVLDSRVDLGLVAEYLFDSRGDEAHNTLFERDLALGTRWHFNDMMDSQALLGVIWDTETDEYVVNLEASRRLGDSWQVLLEGRLFGGISDPEPEQILEDLANAGRKSAALQRDDMLQLEFVRYF